METTHKTLVFTRKNVIRYGFLLGCLFFAMAGKAQTLTAISNVSGAPENMKQSELKAVMMGEKQRWKNGKRVVIALMKTNTPVGKTTSEKVYDMSGEELNKYWLSLVFQGKAQAPVFFTSVTELQSFVAQNPGAIGIIDKPVASAEIRAVTIDGKSSF